MTNRLFVRVFSTGGVQSGMFCVHREPVCVLANRNDTVVLIFSDGVGVFFTSARRRPCLSTHTNSFPVRLVQVVSSTAPWRCALAARLATAVCRSRPTPN